MRSKARTERDLLVPLGMTGSLMAVYLLARPYGDSPGVASTAAQQAAAFASPWWVVAHVAGALALVGFGRLTLRLADLEGEWFVTRLARWAGLAGVMLVLPYFGAETFALHVIGLHATSGETGLLVLVEEIRNQPVAITMFGVGLLLLAVAGIAFALAWTRYAGNRAAWPLGVLMALMLPQFYLPPVGRMAFGLLYLLAAIGLGAAILRRGATSEPVGSDVLTPDIESPAPSRRDH